MYPNAVKSTPIKTPNGKTVRLIEDDEFITQLLTLGCVDVQNVIKLAHSSQPYGSVSQILPTPKMTILYFYFFGYPNPAENGWQILTFESPEWTEKEAIKACKEIQMKRAAL